MCMVMLLFFAVISVMWVTSFICQRDQEGAGYLTYLCYVSLSLGHCYAEYALVEIDN